MKINYKLMTSNDIDGVLEISNLSFSSPWSKDSIKNEINNPIAKYIVAREGFNNNVIGFIGIWIIAGEGDITNIAVHPDYRGKKIASDLLKHLFNLCIDNNCNIINLEVRSSNIAAQNLYKKFDFKEIAIRKGYYSDNKEDAIIMQFSK